MCPNLRSALWPSLALALLLVAVAGCGAAPTPTPDAAQAAETVAAEVAEAEATHPLVGTAWNVDYFGPPEESLPMLPETRASVTYFWDRYAGFDGCNFLLGVYEANAQGELRHYTPAITLDVCEPAALYDQALLVDSSLTNVTAYRLEEGKLIADTVENQRLLTLSPAEVLPMLGTVWELKFWWSQEQEILVPNVQGAKTTITFAAGGAASGNGGCNDYTVSYEGDLQIEQVLEATATFAELPALTFGPVTSQRSACAEPEGVMEQEQAFFTALGLIRYYFKLGGLVLLLDDAGAPVMVLGAPA